MRKRKRNSQFENRDETAFKLVGLNTKFDKISDPRKKSAKMSESYKKIKEQNEKLIGRLANKWKLSRCTSEYNQDFKREPKMASTRPKKQMVIKNRSLLVETKKNGVAKFSYKENFVDEITDLKYNKFICKIADGVGVAFVKVCTDSSMSNDERNIVRVATKVIVAECISQILKEPLEVVNNIKMCIYVANKLYECIVIIDKLSDKYSVDEKSIKEISTTSNEYIDFVGKYPSMSIEKQIQLVDDLKINNQNALDRNSASEENCMQVRNSSVIFQPQPSEGNYGTDDAVSDEEKDKLRRIIEYRNNIANKKCPRCGGVLIGRKNRETGKWFMGCDNYFSKINCNFTIDYPEFKDIEKEVFSNK